MEASRLAAIPLFCRACRGASRGDCSRPSNVEAAEGETLASEGDFGNALYAIESGTAEVSANGKRLRTLGPGDVFGEIAVIASGRRTASVVALSPMRLVALFKRDVWALERRAPDAAERLRALVVERRAAGVALSSG